MSVLTSTIDGVGCVSLEDPPLNILTRRVLADLRHELEHLASDLSLRVLVLSARGKHFSAGADVAEHLAPEYRDLIPEFVQTVTAVADFPVPVVAAVQGRCLGGGFELVCAADLIVAAEGATLGQPEVKLGVFPPAACALLVERCPAGVAAELIFRGNTISAREALEVGLVRRVVPNQQLEATALELAREIARHSASTLRLAKRCLRAGRAAQRQMALAYASRVYLDELMDTDDAVVGLSAFLEKAEPAWRHR